MENERFIIDFEGHRDDKEFVDAYCKILGYLKVLEFIDNKLDSTYGEILNKNQHKALSSLRKKLFPVVHVSIKMAENVSELIIWLSKIQKLTMLFDDLNSFAYEYFDKEKCTNLFSLNVKEREASLSNYLFLKYLTDENEVNFEADEFSTIFQIDKVEIESYLSSLTNLKNTMLSKIETASEEKLKVVEELAELKEKYQIELDKKETEKLELMKEKEVLIDENNQLTAQVHKLSTQQATRVIKEEKSINLKAANVEFDSSFSSEQVIDSFNNDGCYFLGRVNSSKTLGKKSNGTWSIVIEPRYTILKGMNYETFQKFNSQVKLNNESFYVEAIIDNDDVAEILHVRNFDTIMALEDQRTAIFEAIADRELIYSLHFEKNEKEDVYTATARLNDILNVAESDFSETVLIPTVNATVDEFNQAIEKQLPIRITNFSGALYQTLNYVVCDNKLFYVNLQPCNGDAYLWASTDKNCAILTDDFTSITNDTNCIDACTPETAMYYVTSQFLKKLKSLNANAVSKVDILKDINENDSKDELELINCIYKYTQNCHMYYTKNDVINFHTAIKTSPLVILSGASGTGKTQLPLIYYKALFGAETENLLFVPIEPSYTEPADILGFFKPNVITNNSSDGLNFDGTFIESPTGLVSFLKKASLNRSQLHFVIFDEMNLSQIEHWFSPFMSELEKKSGVRKLTLYSKQCNCSNASTFGPEIMIPDNVVFIGTINQDETTTELSDRLMDRAIVINLEKKNFLEFVNCLKEEPRNENIKQFDSNLVLRCRKNSELYKDLFSNKEISFFNELNDFLTSNDYNKQISYRTFRMMWHYLENSLTLIEDKMITRELVFDFMIKQSILSKIRGSDQSVIDILNGLLPILSKASDISDFTNSKMEIDRKLKEINIYGFTR